ncbi:aminotransferase class I/II-fold pyridoxal phosphate-dependent enzyme [Pareuzebyella sediminis]|uniref:aminotransferase class I/II-fold pyridoxal phosphate-dependent enzyme n=1 Tax=Pareuzebyella sediminis TaxID=2607998 RepID=UPI0011ECE347|nr:aminotransferase class I/II-fold pyridoxal phosphate-dependent enzyme [Pareuzebyella sediminis]
MTYTIDSFPGREILIQGEPYLYFGGTSYLGLQTDEAFQHIFLENIKKYGTNYGASRKSNLRLSIFEETERYLADIVGSPASLTLSSGYLAGQLVAHRFHTESYKLFYAPKVHSALFVPTVSASTVKEYTTFTALNIAVRAHLASNHNKSTPVVFLDAIDFSGCNYPDFEALRILPLEDIIVVVDDSHGIGVVGQNGGGVYRKLQELKMKELLVCCSLGKGFGIQAGAIFGTKDRISSMQHAPLFGGASPATPAALATLLEAEPIFEANRKILQGNLAFFLANLTKKKKFTFMENHPAFSFSDLQLTEYLAAHKIVVTSFPYPDEHSPLMSRIVISAAHKKEDIERLLDCINILP